ncbi:protein brawnin-like [Teleopsis dalmanni]|uniref:protein brawnin-like n=1 Tax=Teleopsis dalmanni TaxID=139649 RepID=UPI0018CD5A29|nr:protein brawnin-like [Teleopsis dalmanni]XP_037938465.1 protein brawnin-like [Teleopsis dalmanni]
MPAGVGWGQYIKFFTCAMLSMMAGSQLVHYYYKPLQDLDVYIDNEMKNIGSAEKDKIKIATS